MLASKSTHYLRLGYGAVTSRMQPQVYNMSATAFITEQTNRRNLHIATRPSRLPKNITARQLQPFLSSLAGINSVRFSSEDAANKTTIDLADIPANKTIIDLAEIPEPPVAPPTPLEDLTTQLASAASEPTFASIGLGGWSPVGIVQNCMEFLHIGCDLPWWGAIAVGTIVVRTLIFPLVIMAQRNAAKMSNHMPEMQLLQLKMTEARQMGNALESSRLAQEMMLFMKEKELNPLKNFFVPLAQAPLFISFFMGLRAMANTPVESMRDGGLFWFTDLTMSDPTYLLPLITSATLYLTIEIGTDSARLSAQNMQTMKYVFRALPVVIFPFMMNFPAAILTYWACSNFISLGQVAVLRIPVVREYFKIDKIRTHKTEELPVKKKGFVKGVKESWANMKIARELEERQRLDEIRFAKAGKGPLIKTFKYDPTKPRPASPTSATPSQMSSMSAQKKNN